MLKIRLWRVRGVQLTGARVLLPAHSLPFPTSDWPGRALLGCLLREAGGPQHPS